MLSIKATSPSSVPSSRVRVSSVSATLVNAANNTITLEIRNVNPIAIGATLKIVIPKDFA